MATPRLTKATIGVLEALLAATEENPVWGYGICMKTGIKSGTVYPILERLAERDWVTSERETGFHPGRPPKRFYKLTAKGRLAADVALKERAARHARYRLGSE